MHNTLGILGVQVAKSTNFTRFLRINPFIRIDYLRKIVAISFLLLFFMSQVGYYFSYFQQQQQAKKEMRRRILEGIPDSYLLVIEQTDDVEWVEKGRELMLGDEMYDVIKTKTDKGKTYLYCLNDEEETQVIKKFSKAVKSRTNSSSSGKVAKQILKFQGKTPPSIFNRLISQMDLTSIQKSRGPESRILSTYIEIVVPPPRA